MENQVSERVVAQRVRNRIIDYLETAGSFREQLEYQAAVPWVNIPHEIIAQWEDWVPIDRRTNHWTPGLNTPEEFEAMVAYDSVWERAADALPDDYPSIISAQALPEWVAMRDAAQSALEVFQARGRMPEDHEVDWPA